MRFILIFGFCFVAACSSVGYQPKLAPITFTSVRNLHPGLTTKSEVNALFGVPSKENKQSGLLSWRYNDTDGGQLLSLQFDERTSTLTSVLFVPREEISPADIKEAYPQANFQRTRIVEPSGSDYISSDYKYVDLNSGIQFQTRSDKDADFIAWSTPISVREPSSGGK